MSKTMRQQLSDLDGKYKIKSPRPSPAKWVGDGEDHVNIWEHAETPLGVFLSHGNKFSFTHRYFGDFCNMESFWKYIQSEERDDRLRVMSGPSIRQFSKQLTMLRICNFRAIIMDSEYQKVLQYKKYKKLMMDESLPFDTYYINKKSGVRIRPTYFSWFIAGMNEIRTALINDVEPDFTFLKDKKNRGIYDFVIEDNSVENYVDPIEKLERHLMNELAS